MEEDKDIKLTTPNKNMALSWEEIGKNSEKITKSNPLAKNNITGITQGAGRTVKDFEGAIEEVAKDIDINVFGNQKDWVEHAKLEETVIGQMIDGFAGAAYQTAGGFLMSLGANDPVLTANTAFNLGYNRNSNFLMDLGEKMLETGSKNHHIFDGDDILSTGYWFKQLQSTGFTLGMLLETGVEAYVTRGASFTNSLNKIGALKNFNRAFGAYQGLKETTINAVSTGKEVTKMFTEAGYTEEEALKKGAEAATLNYSLEALPLMLINGLQFGSLSKYGPLARQPTRKGYGDIIGDRIEKFAEKNIKSKAAKKIADYGGQMVSEAFEEGMQTGFSQYAKFKTLEEAGLIKGEDFTTFLFKDNEFRDSMVGGAFGGSLFRFLGKRFENYTTSPEEKLKREEFSAKTDEFISKTAERVNNDTSDLIKAIESSNQDAVDASLKRMQDNSIFESLKFDYFNNSDKAFDTYLSSIKELQNAITTNNTDKLKQFGIDESVDIDSLNKSLVKAEKDAIDIRKKLAKNLQKFDNSEVGFEYTKQEKLYSDLDIYEKEYKEKEKELSLDDNYFSMSSKGREIADLFVERMALLALGNKSSLSKEQKKRFNDINSLIANIEEDKEYIDKAHDERRFGLLDLDERVQNKLNILSIDEYKRTVENNLNDLRNPEFVENKLKERVKKSIDKPQTLEELESIKKTAEELNIYKEIKVKYEQKEHELKTEQALKSTKENEIDESVDESVNNDNVDDNVDDNLGKPKSNTEIIVNKKKLESVNKIISTIPLIETNKNNLIDTPDLLDNSPEDSNGEIVDFFAPASVENLTEKQLSTLANQVAEFYETLEEENSSTPSFLSFMEEFIQLTSKVEVDKIFNHIVIGWERNNYKKEDYDKIYKILFKSKQDIARGLLDFAQSTITEPTDNETLKKSNENTIAKTIIENSPVAERDESGIVKVRHTNPHKANSSEFRASFLGIKYKRTVVENEDGSFIVTEEDISDELVEATDINPKRLLRAEEFNPGEKLKLLVPTNYMDIIVSDWEDDITKVESISFRKWLQKYGVEIGSKEYWDKIPIIAVSKDNEGIFFVHSTDWYNPINVIDNSKENDGKVIQEGKENLSYLRNRIKNEKEINIEIKTKKPGAWKSVETPISLEEANPTTTLGLATFEGNIRTYDEEGFAGKTLEEQSKTLDNSKDFTPKVGHIYDIRKGTTKDSLIALEVLRDKLDEKTVNNLSWIIKIHLDKYNKNYQRQRDEIKRITEVRGKNGQILHEGLDIYEITHFENYLKSFVFTGSKSFSKGVGDKNAQRKNIAKEATNYYEKLYKTKDADGNEKLLPKGTPYIFTQNFTLFFGVVGELNATYILPSSPSSVIEKLSKSLGSFTQNVNETALIENRSTINFDNNGNVIPGDKYQKHLKKNLKTTIKSFDVGEKGKPNYATFIQPVVTFTIDENPIKDFEEGKVSKETVNKIVNKIEQSKPLSNFEEVVAQKEDVKQIIEEEIKKDEKLKLEEELILNDIDSILSGFKDLTSEQDFSGGFGFAPSPLNSVQVEKVKKSVQSLSGLTIGQDYDLVNYIFNQITASINYKYKSKVDKKELYNEIKTLYLDIINNSIKNLEADINKYNKANETLNSDKITIAVGKIEAKLNLIKNLTTEESWKLFSDNAEKKIAKYTSIKEVKNRVEEDKNDEDIDEDIDDNNEREKDYSKSSLEENGKATSSYRLKRFFCGIKNVKSDFTVKTGFLNLPTYIDFDTVYSTVGKVLSSPSEIPSNYDEIIARLKDNINAHKFLKQVVEELENADEQIKNDLTYNFTRHALLMKFITFSKIKEGQYSLKVFDTNSNDVERVILNSWRNSFKQGKLVKTNKDGEYIIDKEEAKIAYQKFKEFQNFIAGKSSNKMSYEDLQEWLLDYFGVYLSEDTLKEMGTRSIYYQTQRGNEKLSLKMMFRETDNTAGIFGLFGNYLSNIIEKEDTRFEENEDNHPFSNANNSLKSIIKIETKYSDINSSDSFRDGGKSIYGFTPTKAATDATYKLKFDGDYRKKLLSKPFNKHSMILSLLEYDPSFKDKFQIVHTGLTAIKEQGKKASDKSGITDLPDTDHEYTKLGFFQDTEQGNIISKMNGIPLRLANMFFTTMSDKSQMISNVTAVLDLKKSNFNDKVNMVNDNVMEVLYNQTVLPELERISNFHLEVKETNIKGYDDGAKLFLMFPQLNNLIDKKTGLNVIRLMEKDPEKYNVNYFNQNYKNEAKQILEKVLKNEVKNKMESWLDMGLIEKMEDANKNTLYRPTFFDHKYLKSRMGASDSENIRISAYDYVINSFINNANVFMIYAGDIATYTKGNKSLYFKGNDVTNPIDTNSYIEYVKSTGINLGKRLALLIAPGNKLANSKGKTYEQIFLEDSVNMTTNVPFLVGLFYNNTEKIKAQKLVNAYNEDKGNQKSIIKILKESYPLIKDYFNIEETDGQEYTTATEHIDILFNQGRLSGDEYQTIKNKIDIQLLAERKGEKIPPSGILNYAELKIVMQPVKPVYTGFIDDIQSNSMRMMYIKCSSYPLLPQVVFGTELDKVRRLLEKAEENEDGSRRTSVRASYQSANKVGANKNTIKLFNGDGSFNDKITKEDIEKASLKLDRENFRIQQDVPFKSDKKDKDSVALATQTLKLLFGDGVLDIENFDYNGKKYSGRELKTIFNRHFEDLINSKKLELYDELGINHITGKPINNSLTISKLQTLLKKEAEERGFPKQDIDALKLIPIYDIEDNIVDFEFSIPIWLSSNSNRYESLLNSLVSKRTAKIKIPGASYVVASEAGYKILSDIIEKQDKRNTEDDINIDTEELQDKPNLDEEVEQTQVTSSDIYSKLGNKTESGNVKVVKNILSNKNNKDIITAFRVDKKLGLLESFRKYNAIGNPINWQGFKPRFEGDNATIAFIDWLLGQDYTDLEQEYRAAILDSLDNLKGKPIEYYKELNAPSHATALDYLINEYDWGTGTTEGFQTESGVKQTSNETTLTEQQNFKTTTPKKYELFKGVFANKEQTEAIDKFKLFLNGKVKVNNQNKFALLKGRGGVGKTTIVKKILEDVSPSQIMYIAPTHQAKNQLSNATGIAASTVASALAIKLNEQTGKFEPDEFARKKGVPISNAKYIVIDESSMLNNNLFDEIEKLTRDDAKIILMGDNAQLPPIGQADDSKVFNYVLSELLQRMRQEDSSPIIPLTDEIANNVESPKPVLKVIKDRNTNFNVENNSGVIFERSDKVMFDMWLEDYKVNPAGTKLITFNNENNDKSQSVKILNEKARQLLYPNGVNEFIAGDILTAYGTYMEGLTPVIENSSDYEIIKISDLKNLNAYVSAYSRAKGNRELNIPYEGYFATVKNTITNEISEIIIPTISSKNKIDNTINNYFNGAGGVKKDTQMGIEISKSFVNLNYGYARTTHKAQSATYRNVYVFEDNILNNPNGNNKNMNQSLYTATSRASDKLVVVSKSNDTNSALVLSNPVQETHLKSTKTNSDKNKNNDLYSALSFSEERSDIASLDSTENIDSSIIFTDKWEGELKAAEFYTDEEGNVQLKKAQVLLPSKFRDNNGKLIQFIFEDGSINEKYVYKENGVLRLKQDMIDEELLNITSFRVPTSSHVSLAQIEIVGILPTEVGDLMIVPRNLMVQKGIDFDIDKETTYMLHTQVDAEGKIRSLSNISSLSGVKEKIKFAEDFLEENSFDKIEANVNENKTKIEKSWVNQTQRLNKLWKQKIQQEAEIDELYENYNNLRETIEIYTDELLELDNEEDVKKSKDTIDILNSDLIKTKQKLDEVISDKVRISAIKERVSKRKNRQNELLEEYKKQKELYYKYKNLKKELKELKKLKIQLLENEFVKIHTSVLTNPDNEMQKKINKVLSMEFAKKQAELIDNTLNSNIDNANFTLLSDTYQKNKMYLGASGKLGIGVYSNYVVFHSMVQQTPKGVLTLQEFDGDSVSNLSIVLGKQKSDGTLGRNNSLAPKSLQRSIAEMFAERQNTATDNEKEQVLGRVNINELTINVDSLLAALGFDKDEMFSLEIADINEKGKSIKKRIFFDTKEEMEKEKEKFKRYKIEVFNETEEVSIPYLFLSQPILKEYVAEIRKTKSKTKKYDSAAKLKVIEQLKNKYKVGFEYDSDAERKSLTGRKLFENLTNPTPSSQLEVLDMFLNLEEFGTRLSGLQKFLNITQKGLGKSFFETIEKKNVLENVVEKFNPNFGSYKIQGVEELIGDILPYNELLSEEKQAIERKENNRRGYVLVGKVWIKPNNPVASMLVHSVAGGYDLFNDKFIYENKLVKDIFDNIKISMNKEGDLSSNKNVELSQDIFKELKKYVNSSSFLNLFETYTEDGVVNNIQKERKRLFIDTADNMSLANYLYKATLGNTPLAQYLKGNKLISRFSYTVNTNLQPSIIKFDNARGENFDEEYLYLAIPELIEQNIKLPNFNGKPYTTRQLAQDLALYAFAEGGVQEAIQYVKYIPVGFLEAIGFSEEIKGIGKNYDSLSTIFAGDANGFHFERQFFQHNPSKVPIISIEHIKSKEQVGRDLKNLVSFEIDFSDMSDSDIEKYENKRFISIYNPKMDKGLKKHQLYESTSDGVYHRISTLGVFGMSEYVANEPYVESLTDTNLSKVSASKPVKKVVAKVSPEMGMWSPSNTVNSVLEEISKYKFEKYKGLEPLAEIFSKFLPNTELNIADFEKVFGVSNAAGRFFEGKIYIDKNFWYNKSVSKEEKAKVTLHEVVHSLTSSFVDKWINKDGVLRHSESNTPKEILDLMLLYNFAKKHIGAARRNKLLKDFSNDIPLTTQQRNIDYGIKDIHEFMAYSFTEEEFQKELNNIKYLNTNISIFDKLSEIVKNIIKRVVGSENYNKESVTSQAITTTLKIVKQQYIENKNLSKTRKSVVEDNKTEILLGNEESKITTENMKDKDIISVLPNNANELYTSKDILYKHNEKYDLKFLTSDEDMAFSEELLNRVVSGEQQITIRQPKYYKRQGVIRVGGRLIMIHRIGNEPINIKYLLDRGATKEHIEKIFKGVKSEKLKEGSIRDWFKGIGKRDVFFIKDVTNQIKERIDIKQNKQENYFTCV